jgi:hemerythrin-like metal-binding protein
MQWRDEYATGVEQVDVQHRTLFRAAGDFREALDEGQGTRSYAVLLDFLEGYCRAHFGFEERCMEQARCPAAQANREAHSEFVQVLAGFRRRFDDHGFHAGDARELVDTLERWLSGHICRLDVQLRGLAGKLPVELRGGPA